VVIVVPTRSKVANSTRIIATNVNAKRRKDKPLFSTADVFPNHEIRTVVRIVISPPPPNDDIMGTPV